MQWDLKAGVIVSMLHHNSNVNVNSKGLRFDHVTWNATHLSILMETANCSKVLLVWHSHTLTKWKKEQGQISFGVGVLVWPLFMWKSLLSLLPLMLLLSALRVSGLDLWVCWLSCCLGLGVILFFRFFLQGWSWSVTDLITSQCQNINFSISPFPDLLPSQSQVSGFTQRSYLFTTLFVSTTCSYLPLFRNTHLELFLLISTVCSREILPFYATNILMWGKKIPPLSFPSTLLSCFWAAIVSQVTGTVTD